MARREELHVVTGAFGHSGKVIAGRLLGDVLITREEIQGLMAGLLCTDSPPAGATRLTDWIRTHARRLGVRYASELRRRSDRRLPYGKL
jgi:NADH dehydrogenase